MTEEEADVAVRGILRDLGLSFTEDTPRGGDLYLWTGNQFHIGEMTAANIIHEIAHWLVATEEERNTPEFNLGLAPEPGCRTLSRKMPKKEAQCKECMASVLGIQIELTLGLPWEKTHSMHGWSDTDQSFEDRVALLKGKGFLNAEGRPTFLKVPE